MKSENNKKTHSTAKKDGTVRKQHPKTNDKMLMLLCINMTQVVPCTKAALHVKFAFSQFSQQEVRTRLSSET